MRRFDGWPAVALVAVAFGSVMVGTTLPTPLYPTYAAELGFGELVTTVVFAAYAVGVIVALVLVGHWSDQLGRRPMLFAGLALSGLAAVAFLLPAALGWLFVGRVLSGFSAGILTGTGTATLVDLAPLSPPGRSDQARSDQARSNQARSNQARASLVAAAVNMTGLGAGPVLAGLLVQLAPAPTHLTFVVDLCLVAVGVVCVLVVEEPVARQVRPRLAPRPLQVPAEARTVFVRAAIAGFAGFAVLGLFTAVSPAFLGTVLDRRSPALVGVVVAVLLAGSVVGQLVSARLGTDRALRVGCGLLIVGMALVAAALLVPSLGLLVVGGAVAGLGQGSTFRAGLGGVSAASPEQVRGQVTSTFFVTLYVGLALPVIGLGTLATLLPVATGLVTAGVVFAVLVALLAVVALVLLR